jgi:hypothetical protein
MINHAVPVALPMPDQGAQSPNAKLTPIQRPSVGPVVPLTAVNVGSDELLGGPPHGNRSQAIDTSVSRVLVRCEPILAPNGRADDFSWPRKGVNIDTSPLETLAETPAPVPVQEKAVAVARQGAQTASVTPPVQRRSHTGDQLRLPFFFSNLFR